MIAMLRRLRRRRKARRQIRIDQELFLREHPELRTGDTVDGAKVARSLARAAGWKRIDGRDLCPHAVKVVEAK